MGAMARTGPRTAVMTKTAPGDYAGLCGLYWEGDAAYESGGATCGTQEEGGFGNVCPVYACAKEHGVAHCGVCPEFPCPLLVNLAAVSKPDDPRIESAALRAEVGDEKWAQWAHRRQIWRGAFCPLWQRCQRG
jgi:uncharacterized protein DUF3795